MTFLDEVAARDLFNTSPSTLLYMYLIYLASVTIILSLAWTFYVLLLHPLADFPGPKSRAISPLFLVYSTLKGREPRIARDLHERYGPIVRMAPNVVSIISTDAWDHACGGRGSEMLAHHMTFRPYPTAQDMLYINGNCSKRDQAFIDSNPGTYVTWFKDRVLHPHADRLLSALDAYSDGLRGPLDVGKMMTFLAFDYMGDLMVDADFATIDSHDYRAHLGSLSHSQRLIAAAEAARLLGVLAPIAQYVGPKQDEFSSNRVSELCDMVQRRLDRFESGARIDLMTLAKSMLSLDSYRHISNDVMLFSTADTYGTAFEGLANALTGALYLVASHPDSFHKLRKEVEDKFANEGKIEGESTYELTYLNAVVKECVRLCPPTPGSSIWANVSARGSVVAGRLLHGGTTITFPILASSQSSANFARPREFAPERWLPEPERPAWAAADRRGASDYCLDPSPTGRMWKFAHAELRVILARVALRFDIELADSAFDPETQNILGNVERQPLMMWIREREPK